MGMNQTKWEYELETSEQIQEMYLKFFPDMNTMCVFALAHMNNAPHTRDILMIYPELYSDEKCATNWYNAVYEIIHVIGNNNFDVYDIQLATYTLNSLYDEMLKECGKIDETLKGEIKHVNPLSDPLRRGGRIT